MKCLHIITPVKDSIDSTLETVKAIMESDILVPFTYTVYNDFSTEENTHRLEEAARQWNFRLVNLSDLTDHPSPNYLLVLQTAQKEAIEADAGLLIVESDVIVKKNTLQSLYNGALQQKQCGIAAAVTTDEKGIINNFVAVSVEAGNEAITEVMEEKTVDREEKIDPVMERERLPEEQKPNVTEDTEQKIITAVAAVTGIALSELNRLPVDIKSDIISEFQQNNGNIAAEQLTERICEIADIEPPEIIKPAEPEIKPQENKEKENPLRELEDLLEENDNYFDGMLNNLPPEKPVKQEREDSHDEPLLSRSRIMSNDFKPLSEKSNEDIEKSNNKKHDLSI